MSADHDAKLERYRVVLLANIAHAARHVEHYQAKRPASGVWDEQWNVWQARQVDLAVGRYTSACQDLLEWCRAPHLPRSPEAKNPGGARSAGASPLQPAPEGGLL